MSHVLIWTGPVSAQQIRASVPPGIQLVNIPCTGDDPRQTCGQIADAWPDKLAKLRALAKRSTGEPLDASIAGFSAGGQICKRVLVDPKARAEVSGACLSDAFYEVEWIDKGAGIGRHVEGFVMFAIDAAQDGRPMLATVSANPNKAYPSGSATMAGTVLEIERRIGRKMEDATDDPVWLRLDKPPVRAWRLGSSVLFGDFGLNYKHAEHATHIAAELWPGFFESRRAASRTAPTTTTITETKMPASTASNAPTMPASAPSSPTTTTDLATLNNPPSGLRGFLYNLFAFVSRIWGEKNNFTWEMKGVSDRDVANAQQEGPAPALPDDWKGYAGARPELRGYPEGTVIAVPGLMKQPPGVRAKLLDTAETLGIPVDTLAIVIQSESGWDPTAPAQKTGLPRGGLVQLTQGANLPGFNTPEKIWAVREMSAEDQLEKIVIPLWSAVPQAKRANLTPGRGYMRNFLPADADRDPNFILGDGRVKPPTKAEDDSPEARNARWRFAVYSSNPGFDRRPGPFNGKSGYITIDDVLAQAASIAKKTGGKRVNVAGDVITSSSPDSIASASSSSTPSSTTSSKPASSSSSVVAARTLSPDAPASSSSSSSPASESSSSISEISIPSSSSSPSDNSSPSTGEVDNEKPSRGLLLAAVKSGSQEAPTWVLVPWKGLLVRVGRDALRAKVGGQLLRLPVSFNEHVTIARSLGWVLPTPDLSDAIYDAAQVKLVPAPQGRWPNGTESEEEQKRIVQDTSKKQGLLGFVVAMNQDVDAQIEKAGAAPTALVADPGKDWVLFPRATGVQNYGWHTGKVSNRYKLGGGLKQPLGPSDKPASHNSEHSDYSQLLRPIKRMAKRASDGVEVDLLDFFETLPAESGAPVKLTSLLRT